LTPGAEYVLGYTTITPCSQCACIGGQGDAYWKIQWTLSPAPLPDGFIVQMVSLSNFRVGCHEFTVGPPPPLVGWEAWQVQGGSIYQGYAKHGNKPGIDTDRATLNPFCSWGKFNAVLEARFFVGVPINWEEAPGPDGPLPYTFTQPPFWSKPDSNTVTRKMTADWACCPPICNPCGGVGADDCNLTCI
jgi:hypothetical protein